MHIGEIQSVVQIWRGQSTSFVSIFGGCALVHLFARNHIRFSHFPWQQSIQRCILPLSHYREHFIEWYETEHGLHIKNYTDINLRIIASFYGNQKLQ